MKKTWAHYDLKEFGKRSPTRFHEKNDEGWFRVDLRSGWVPQADFDLRDQQRDSARRFGPVKP